MPQLSDLTSEAIGELLAEEAELSRTELKQLLEEGVAAHKAAQAYAGEIEAIGKNKAAILDEKKAAAQALADITTRLQARGVGINDLDKVTIGVDESELAARFNKQMEEAQKSSREEIAARIEENGRLQAEIQGFHDLERTRTIAKAFMEAATAKNVGVSPDFLDYYQGILNQNGIEFFLNDDGKVLGKKPGDAIPQNPVTLLGSLKTDPKFAHFYGSNFTGGSGTAPGGRNKPTENPWITGNLMAQTKIYNENPALAATLEADAKSAKNK